MTELSWIGFDFDGTLAESEGVWKGIDYTGKPIKLMVELMKQVYESGIKVKIFTARVAPRVITSEENTIPMSKTLGDSYIGEPFVWKLKPGCSGLNETDWYKRTATSFINEWSEQNLGFVPEVTCVKDQYMESLYDDRVRQVVKNKGVLLTEIINQLWERLLQVNEIVKDCDMSKTMEEKINNIVEQSRQMVVNAT